MKPEHKSAFVCALFFPCLLKWFLIPLGALHYNFAKSACNDRVLKCLVQIQTSTTGKNSFHVNSYWQEADRKEHTWFKTHTMLTAKLTTDCMCNRSSVTHQNQRRSSTHNASPSRYGIYLFCTCPLWFNSLSLYPHKSLLTTEKGEACWMTVSGLFPK